MKAKFFFCVSIWVNVTGDRGPDLRYTKFWIASYIHIYCK